MVETKETAQNTNEKPTFLDRLRSATPDIVTNNAPRVVSTLKICGSTAMLFSKNLPFKIAGAGFITANTIIILFGKKKTEEEKENLRQEKNSKAHDKQEGKFTNYIYKALHPSKYPIESGSSVATVSSGFWTAAGVLGKDGFSPGRLVGGLLSLASDANLAFTKEKIGEPEANTHEKGSVSYYVTEMKNRPVLASSALNIGCDIASIAGGAHELSKGKEANTLLAGLFLLSANLFQAIFVNKNDYNIEKKSGNKSEAKSDESLKNPQVNDTAAKSSWSERAKNKELSEELYSYSR